MKKFIALFLVLVLALSVVGCSNDDIESNNDESKDNVENNNDENNNDDESKNDDEDAKSEGVMTYAEYAAAELEAEVVIEAYVQAKQVYAAAYSNTSLYLQDKDGAYFVYRMPCTQEQYDSIAIGSKIKVTGYKAEWSGEVEITDATFEVLEGNYIAEAIDLTDKLGTEELINYQNMFAAFKGLTLEAVEYKNGEPGNDIYLTLGLNGASYSFCVESDLVGADTAEYQAVAELNVGDVVDIEGFAYWYEGINTHVTSIKVAQ